MAVDQNLFRDVIGRFASGVTVISTNAGGRDLGTTASAVSSLSMEPPMLLICMNRTSETGQAIASEQAFVVNILGEHQMEIANRFATKAPDKFSGIGIERTASGLPMISQALAHLECRVSETATGGTHLVFLSLVEQADATEGSPLTYYRGRFGRFEEAAQEGAYRELRRLVLDRRVGPGEDLDVESLSAQLELERSRVVYALMKLSAEGLVERSGDGWNVRPMDERLATEAVETRRLIQSAVAERVAGQLTPQQQAELERYAQAAVSAVERTPPDLDALRLAGRDFHEAFIGLLGNQTLLDIYRRLRIDSIWLRMAPGRYASPYYLLRLVAACAAGEADVAKRTLEEHARDIRGLISETLARAGGAV